MKNVVKLSLAGGFIALASCTNLSDKKVEQPYAISTIDLNEADYVRQVLESTDGAKGNFRVEPGSTVTTIYFKSPDKPLSEEQARAWMRSIKDELTKSRGREANDLKFVFKDVTLIEWIA